MLKATFVSVAKGIDALTGKEGDGVHLLLADGRERFLSWKSLRQFVQMELASSPPAKEKSDKNGPVATPLFERE